jgi:hypothetical protein
MIPLSFKSPQPFLTASWAEAREMDWALVLLIYPVYVVSYQLFKLWKIGRKPGKVLQAGPPQPSVVHSIPTAIPTSLSMLPPLKASKSYSCFGCIKLWVCALFGHVGLILSSLPRATRTMLWVVQAAFMYKWWVVF